VFACAVLMTK